MRISDWSSDVCSSDLLTTLGFFGAVLVAAGYMLSWIDDEWLGLSLAGYIVNWFGDSLDGSLARWRRIERPAYGYFVDHSVDGQIGRASCRDRVCQYV